VFSPRYSKFLQQHISNAYLLHPSHFFTVQPIYCLIYFCHSLNLLCHFWTSRLSSQSIEWGLVICQTYMSDLCARAQTMMLTVDLYPLKKAQRWLEILLWSQQQSSLQVGRYSVYRPAAAGYTIFLFLCLQQSRKGTEKLSNPQLCKNEPKKIK